MTGQTLHMWFDAGSREHKLSMGDQTATILRPDVVLENGVLHIIDKVLLVPTGAEDQPLRSLTAAEPSAKATTGAAGGSGSGSGNSTTRAGEQTGGTKEGTASGAGVSRGVSAQLTMMALMVGAVMLLVE